MILQTIALTIQPPCQFGGGQRNRTFTAFWQTRLAGERNEPVFAYPPVAEEVGVEPTRDWLLRTLFKSVATALWLALPFFKT